jgi:hypothetical protein
LTLLVDQLMRPIGQQIEGFKPDYDDSLWCHGLDQQACTLSAENFHFLP